MGEDRERQGNEAGARGIGSPLPAGTRVGPYQIMRLVKSTDVGRTYLARLAREGEGAPDSEHPTEGAEPVFHLIERPAEGHDGVRPLLALGLRHPQILAPCALLPQDGRDYLVVEAVEERHPPDARPPLDAAGALAAGVGLADALTYLHQTGVVHLRVSPASVVVQGNRAFLAGIEECQLIHPLDPQAPPLFARDANFLARTLGVLAGITDVDAAQANGADPLALIVERGAANGFSSAHEVGMACAAALPEDEVRAAAAAPPAVAGRLTFSVAIATSVGCVREENQDAGASALFEVRDDAGSIAGAPVPVGIFLVADGMGGEERGELASRITARTVIAEIVRQLVLPALHTPVEAAMAGLSAAEAVPPSPMEALLSATRAANALVRKLGATLGKATGTTLTAIAAVGTRAALAHVGDSRAYLLHDDQLKQLTEDHTILARLQAMDHPLLHDPAFAVPRSYLYRSIGQEDEPEIDASELWLASGDRLLLCSDGLWDEVDASVLRDLLASASAPQECADALVAAANVGGGHDNSTAVVIFVHDSGAPPPSASGEAAPRAGGAGS